MTLWRVVWVFAALVAVVAAYRLPQINADRAARASETARFVAAEEAYRSERWVEIVKERGIGRHESVALVVVRSSWDEIVCILYRHQDWRVAKLQCPSQEQMVSLGGYE